MSIYRYKLDSEYIRNLFIYLDLLFIFVPNFAYDILRLGLLADHKVMPDNHISESLPNEIFKKHKWFKNLWKIDVLVFRLGSYMISL